MCRCACLVGDPAFINSADDYEAQLVDLVAYVALRSERPRGDFPPECGGYSVRLVLGRQTRSSGTSGIQPRSRGCWCGRIGGSPSGCDPAPGTYRSDRR